jgi:hypothetical protein
VKVAAATVFFNSAGTCCWNALDCLSVESFPTRLRTGAMAVLATGGRFGGILAQLVFAYLIGLPEGAGMLVCLVGRLLTRAVMDVLLAAAFALTLAAVAAAFLTDSFQQQHEYLYTD